MSYQRTSYNDRNGVSPPNHSSSPTPGMSMHTHYGSSSSMNQMHNDAFSPRKRRLGRDNEYEQDHYCGSSQPTSFGGNVQASSSFDTAPTFHPSHGHIDAHAQGQNKTETKDIALKVGTAIYSIFHRLGLELFFLLTLLWHLLVRYSAVAATSAVQGIKQHASAESRDAAAVDNLL